MQKRKHPVPDVADGALVRAHDERVNWVSSIPFFLVHALCLAVIFTGVTPTAVVLFLGAVLGPDVLRHRRLPPLLLAQELQARPRSRSSSWPSAPRPPRRRASLWWAANHRTTTATPTPTATSTRRARASGGATSAGSSATSTRRPTYDGIKDFAQYPELRWLEPARLDRAVDASAVVCFLIGGWSGLVVGLLLVDGAAVARDVPRELGSPTSSAGAGTTPPTPAATRSSSPCSPAARAGTTTTTTTRLGPPGVLLVGDRPDLLRLKAMAGSAS